MSQPVSAAFVYDALKGNVTLLAGINSFSVTAFAAPIHYHRIEANDEEPDVSAVIEGIPDPSATALFIDAGGRDDVHVVSGAHFLLAKKRKLKGIVVNGMVRGDAYQKLEGVLWLFAIGRCLTPWHPAEEQLALSYFDEAASQGAWLVGDADGVIVVEAAQANSIGLRLTPRPRIG